MHLSRVHMGGHLHKVTALAIKKMRIWHSFKGQMHLSRVHVGGQMHQVTALAIKRMRI